MLLEALRPSLHMQAALYAHAVGAWGAALRHYALAADAGAGDPLVEPQARCLAALARLAQGGPDAGGLRLRGMLGIEFSLRWSAGSDSLCQQG